MTVSTPPLPLSKDHDLEQGCALRAGSFSTPPPVSRRPTVRPSDSHRRSWAGSKPLSFEQVVVRLVAAAQLLPEARAIGTNHWYHDDCEATSRGAVRSGLQHMSFWPMLLQLPAPVPPELATYHGCMEDDEFCWRLVCAYGPAALVKLRYATGSNGNGGGLEQKIGWRDLLGE